MAWVRVGDEALSHPKLMALYDIEGAEDISIIEMFGFLMALATYSAKHLTDGIIERGACFRDGERSRVVRLIDAAVAAELLTWVEVDGARKLRLFTDEEFIHIQPREEVMRRRARSRENRDKDKKAAVIYRDGDQCRYCGKIVRWTGPIGLNLGTLDHVDPDSLGDAPVEGLVVACHECNSSRGHAREAFDAASPVSESILRPGADHHRPDGRGASTPICSPAWMHHEASAAASSSAAARCCGYSEDEPGGRLPPEDETAEGASSPPISSPTSAGIVRTTAWSLPQQRAHKTPT